MSSATLGVQRVQSTTVAKLRPVAPVEQKLAVSRRHVGSRHMPPFLLLASVSGFYGYLLPFDLALSTSTLVELVAWIAVLLAAPDVGSAYLGTQGDVGDAPKRITCAVFGALFAMAVTARINAYCRRDFSRDFLQSLEVEHAGSLGENRLDGARRGGMTHGVRQSVRSDNAGAPACSSTVAAVDSGGPLSLPFTATRYCDLSNA